MKRLLLFTLLILACLYRVSAQEGYIISDSLSRFGVSVELGSRKSQAHKVTEVINQSRGSSYSQSYTPDDILAYGAGGKDFESKQTIIDGKQRRVFLEKILTSGQVTVWCTPEAIRISTTCRKTNTCFP